MGDGSLMDVFNLRDFHRKSIHGTALAVNVQGALHSSREPYSRKGVGVGVGVKREHHLSRRDDPTDFYFFSHERMNAITSSICSEENVLPNAGMRRFTCPS